MEITLGCRHFNSHPHEEDDYTQALAELEKLISTHILTKRMTFLSCRSVHSFCNISTHILTKRMTESVFRLPVFPCISTHILTKRMTCTSTSGSSPPFHFNSHPHEEDDSIPIPVMNLVLHFNSHPHEEDDSEIGGLAKCTTFQLTSSRRG